MVLPKVLIRFEDWKFYDFYSGVRRGCTQHTHSKEVVNAVLDVEEWRSVPDDYRLNRHQAAECPILELQQVSTVCSSTFWVKDQRWVETLLAFYLPLFNQLHHIFPVPVLISIVVKTP